MVEGVLSIWPTPPSLYSMFFISAIKNTNQIAKQTQHNQNKTMLQVGAVNSSCGRAIVQINTTSTAHVVHACV